MEDRLPGQFGQSADAGHVLQFVDDDRIGNECAGFMLVCNVVCKQSSQIRGMMSYGMLQVVSDLRGDLIHSGRNRLDQASASDDGIEPFCGLSALKDNLIWIVEDNSGGTMDIDINYEGSYIIEIDGSWYYFGSQGSCCSGVDSTYRVKVGKSDSFFGDFKGSDGKKLHEGTYGDLVIGPSEQVAGTGHNTIVRDFAGDYWIFYHGFDINGEFPNERVPFIDKLLFDEGTGMPYVSGYKASYREEKVGPCVIASYQ